MLFPTYHCLNVSSVSPASFLALLRLWSKEKKQSLFKGIKHAVLVHCLAKSKTPEKEQMQQDRFDLCIVSQEQQRKSSQGRAFLYARREDHILPCLQGWVVEMGEIWAGLLDNPFTLQVFPHCTHISPFRLQFGAVETALPSPRAFVSLSGFPCYVKLMNFSDWSMLFPLTSPICWDSNC